MKCNDLTVNKLKVKQVFIGNGNNLQINAKNNITLKGANITNTLDANGMFNVFIPGENGNGFGIFINKDNALIGYSNEKDFKNGNCTSGFNIGKDKINVIGTEITTEVTIDSITNEEIIELFS